VGACFSFILPCTTLQYAMLLPDVGMTRNQIKKTHHALSAHDRSRKIISPRAVAGQLLSARAHEMPFGSEKLHLYAPPDQLRCDATNFVGLLRSDGSCILPQ
jgi:hypothetical protein